MLVWLDSKLLRVRHNVVTLQSALSLNKITGWRHCLCFILLTWTACFLFESLVYHCKTSGRLPVYHVSVRGPGVVVLASVVLTPGNGARDGFITHRRRSNVSPSTTSLLNHPSHLQFSSSNSSDTHPPLPPISSTNSPFPWSPSPILPTNNLPHLFLPHHYSAPSIYLPAISPSHHTHLPSPSHCSLLTRLHPHTPSLHPYQPPSYLLASSPFLLLPACWLYTLQFLISNKSDHPTESKITFAPIIPSDVYHYKKKKKNQTV